MLDRGDCWQRAYVIPKGGIGGVKSEVFEALRARAVEKFALGTQRLSTRISRRRRPVPLCAANLGVGSALWVISEIDILTLLFGRDRRKRGMRGWWNGGLGHHGLRPCG